jgi:transcriptional regulator with XRE-family HTH domain
MDTKAVGKRISLYRDRSGLTQVALAEKIGCTPQHVSAMERGVKTPTLETFVAIANALQVRTDLLLQDVLEGWQEGGFGQCSGTGAAWNQEPYQKEKQTGAADGRSHQE